MFSSGLHGCKSPCINHLTAWQPVQGVPPPPNNSCYGLCDPELGGGGVGEDTRANRPGVEPAPQPAILIWSPASPLNHPGALIYYHYFSRARVEARCSCQPVTDVHTLLMHDCADFE